MTDFAKDLDAALADAHLPALLMALVHLTGDAGLLAPERRPTYVLLADGKDGGYPEAVKDDIRTRAKAAIAGRLEERLFRRSHRGRPSAA